MKIAIIADHFTLGSPAQQLLDRFLIGFTRDGIFQPANPSVIAHAIDQTGDLLARRVQDFRLQLAGSLQEAMAMADAILLIQSSFLPEVLNSAREKIPIFVYGHLGPTKKVADEMRSMAAQRNLPLCAGTVAAVLPQLPRLEIPRNHRVIDALIVAPSGAESLAIDGLFTTLDKAGANFGKNWNVRVILDDSFWRTRDQRWSGRLLEAALSRSDKIQGNTLLDGRTEDIAGLGLVPKMAKKPRMAIYEPDQKWRAAILVAEDLIGDIVLAIETKSGFGRKQIHSTQLFQAPAPQHEHFSRLAAVLDDYFTSGKPPWPITRSVVSSIVAEHFPGLR